MLTRVYGVAEPGDLGPEYAEGLRGAVGAAVDYGLTVIEHGEEHSPPLPPVLLAQARMAARAGVSLDTVLRRYFAGHAQVVDFLMQEGGLLSGASMQRLLRAQATLFERLLAVVSEEHVRESENRLSSTEERRTERVKRLLAGELLDTSEFAYDFEANHLGMIAQGPGSGKAIRGLAEVLDGRLLLARPEEGTAWAWLGCRHGIESAEVERLAGPLLPPPVILALGEPAQGLPGWRLTHQQARAALPIALRGPRVVRYAEVALLASMIQDDLLATSLRELYLEPLEDECSGGQTFRETLRAYFAADRNISSTAAMLGVSRHTISSRLRLVEQQIGQPLNSCAAEVEAALRLEALLQPV